MSSERGITTHSSTPLSLSKNAALHESAAIKSRRCSPLTNQNQHMQIYVAKSGQQTGPFSEEQLQSMLSSRMVALTDSAWHDGLSSWIPLHQVLNVSPPLPTAAVPPPFQSRSPVQIQSTGEPASFGIRFGAHIIDSIVTYILGFVAGFFVGAILVAGGTTSSGTLGGFGAIAGLVASWLYYALMESSTKQATLGKQACGLVVTDLQGQRISFGQASGRYFGMFVSTLTLFIGFLMCAWTERKQCLHDMMASCLVLKK